jgi:diguanylate cyclase (GGDEF)-like protein
VVKASWRAIVLPITGLIVGVGSLVLATTELTERNTEAAAGKRERVAFEALAASSKLQHAVAEVYLSTWHETLGNPPRQPFRISALSDAVRSFSNSLRPDDREAVTAGLQRALDLVRQIAEATDNKAKLGLLSRLSFETQEIGMNLGDRGGPITTNALKLLAVPNRIIDLDDAITIDRMATGVDPMTTRRDLKDYVAGIHAGRGDPNPEMADLTDVLVESFAPSSSMAKRLAGTEGTASVRSFADEAAWMLTGARPGVLHPKFAEYGQSADAALNHVQQIVTDELRERQADLQKDLNNQATQQRLHIGLAIAALALAVVALGMLVTRVRRMLRTLRQASEIDPVTMLLNRNGLRSRVGPWFAVRSNHTLAVAVVDLDHFKSVNDVFGHAVGDAILREVGTRVTNEVVASSTAVARWGGDEFVLVFQLRGDATAAIESVCARMRAALALPLEVGQTPISITVSVGAALCVCGLCDVDDLFRVADHLLLATKRETRDASAVGTCGREPASPVSTGSPTRRSGLDRRSAGRDDRKERAGTHKN